MFTEYKRAGKKDCLFVFSEFFPRLAQSTIQVKKKIVIFFKVGSTSSHPQSLFGKPEQNTYGKYLIMTY